MSTSLSKAANHFAIELFQTYYKRHPSKNLLLCPYLIFHSLAMLLVGAKGNTAQQLENVLRLPTAPPSTTPTTTHTNTTKREKSAKRAVISTLAASNEQSLGKSSRKLTPDGPNEFRHRDFLWLTEQLVHGNHEFVHLASFIYLDKVTRRTERFKNVLRDYYETKPKKISFDNVDLMVKTINEDVARTTENIYNDILSKQEAQKLEKSYMLLVNAVFFRGFWLSNFTEVKPAQFRKGATSTTVNIICQQPSASKSTSPASSVSGSIMSGSNSTLAGVVNQIVNVNMMTKLDYLPVVEDSLLEARMVMMPFEASDLQMLLILPNDRQSDSTYLTTRLTDQKIDSVIDRFAKSKSRPVRVSMPVFCIDSGKISIQSTLVQMGAGDLFDKNKANMSGLCENKSVWLNKILHRCFIICDNRGAITSSSSEKAQKRQAKIESGIMSAKNGIEEFIADHPFMYIILDIVTKTILLMGLYTDPIETLEVVHESQLGPEEAHQIYTEGVYKT